MSRRRPSARRSWGPLPVLMVSMAIVGACSPPATSIPSFAPSPSPSPSAAIQSPPPPSTAPSPSPVAGIVLATSEVPRASGSVAQAKTAAASIDAFGFDLYPRIAKKGSNLVFSPLSIVYALAMTRAGAVGTTAAEMDDVLHASSWDRLGAGLDALDQVLATRNGVWMDVQGTPLGVQLHDTNAPFAQVGYPLQQAYLDTLARWFGAGLRQVDFASDPAVARGLINGWVSDQTAGRIPELLGSDQVSAATRLVLVNAVYLKAPWSIRIREDQTTQDPFTRIGGTKVSVPMMHYAPGPLLKYPAAVGTGWRAVELPFYSEPTCPDGCQGGPGLVFDLIVPTDLAAFEARLGATLPTILATLADPTGSVHTVDVSLPRFATDTRADLKGALTSLGMPTAFDSGAADLSGITTAERLFIASVAHQANITLDEQGVEAAAATAIDVAGGPGDNEPPIVIRADRPFLFAIRDNETGAILFLGRVVDPTVK